MFAANLLESYSFLMRNRKGVNLEGSGEKVGGVEGQETVLRIYCMRKESIFNKRKKIKV